MGVFDDLFGKKDETKKINVLGKEYEINPEAIAFSQIGLENYEKKNYKNSIDAFSRAINLTPSNQNFYTMRGTAYEDMGNDIEAEKDFRKTIEIECDNFVAAYRLGMIYFRKKDFENAITWLKISHQNAPDEDLSHIGITNNNIFFIHKKIIAGNLGNFLTQIKKYEDGIKYLDEAIKLDPKYHNPYMVKGMAYIQMGKQNEGIPYLQKAAELGNPHAEKMMKMLEQAKEESAESQDEELELEFVFLSTDHLRYENGKLVSGPHGGAPRAIKVEPNISGNKGYTVTIFNTEGGQAVVQMAPKQMKLADLNNEKIVLRGYGRDAMGASFADYGLTIFHSDGTIEKCALHMYDRNIEIEYLT